MLQLIRKYLPDLEEFGRVALKMQSFDSAGGKQEREIADLNERTFSLEPPGEIRGGFSVSGVDVFR